MMNNKYFTTREVLEKLIDEVLQHEGAFSPEVLEELGEKIAKEPHVYNGEEAEAALLEYGIFDALAEVAEFDDIHLGYNEPRTDLAEPYDLACRLWEVVVSREVDRMNYRHDFYKLLAAEVAQILKTEKENLF